MSKRDLIATRDFSYSTRRLRAGDLIEGVPHGDARVLIAIGKAREVRETAEVPAPPADVIAAAQAVTPQKAPEPAPARQAAPTRRTTSTSKRSPPKKAGPRSTVRKGGKK